jgi:uncharacterized membrane protein
MGLLNRFEQGNLRLTRIEALSDGVFAIVVTLLVLELKVPTLHDRRSVGELRGQLLELLPKFLSWLISFIIVCKFWLNHHLGRSDSAHHSEVLCRSAFVFGWYRSGLVQCPCGVRGLSVDSAFLHRVSVETE